MKKYFISYKTWCDDEVMNIEKIIHFDNSRDLIYQFSNMSAHKDMQIINICKINFKTLEIKKLDVKLNENFKLELIGDN